MAFEESHQRQDKQTRYDRELCREKGRKIKEYQRPFLAALGIIKAVETQTRRDAEAPRPVE